jgi:acyl carrier protein
LVTRETILTDVKELLDELTGDWELESEIREDSLLLGDVGLESIDLVALGTGMEEKYQRPLQYPRLLTQLVEQQRQDLSVAELVDFLLEQLNGNGTPPAR